MHDDRLDDVVAGAVPAAGDGRRRSSATRPSSPAACSPRTASASVDGDTVTVTGRWQWGSGTQHCQWILGGTRCDDDTFRLCWFEAADVTFHDTWYTSGLRGTGSLDFSVDGVAVPLDRTIQPCVTRPDGRRAARPRSRTSRSSPPASPRSASASAGGRSTSSSPWPRASGRSSRRKTLAQSAFTQIELARAEAALRAARAFLHDEVGRAWDVARRRRAGRRRRPGVGIRLAGVNAAARGRRGRRHAPTPSPAARASTSSNVLQRCLRDAHVPTQHLRSPRSSRDARPAPPRPGRRHRHPLTPTLIRVFACAPSVCECGAVRRSRALGRPQTLGWVRQRRGRGPRGCGGRTGESSGGTTRPISVRPAAA